MYYADTDCPYYCSACHRIGCAYCAIFDDEADEDDYDFF